MIEEIQIRDLGVISEAQLSFHKGLTVLTGETGAGKTMVLTALGLLLGQRSDSGNIRAGTMQCSVEGRWKLSESHDVLRASRDAGALVEDGELLLARSVGVDGRSKAILGGRAVPVGILNEIGEQLVVVHGQSDQIRLKSPTAQKSALDRFAGVEHQQLVSEYQKVYESWKLAANQLEEIKTNSAKRLDEQIEIKESLDFLEKLELKPNEDVELAELAQKLTHTEDLRLAVSIAHDALHSDGFDANDSIALVGKARKALESAANIDSKLEAEAQLLREIGENLNEIAASLSGYLSELEGDSGMSIDQIQERRSQIASALRRFGPTLDDVFDFQEISQKRILDLDSSAEKITELEAVVSKLESEAFSLARAVSQNRVKAAELLGRRVTEELVALAMGGSSLQVSVTVGNELGITGLDSISFLLESYAGAEARALGKGASGGELSRIMLAIEVILAETDTAPTFIFDEVDAGVGGAAAIEVGRRLAKLAKNAQVIVVTHLAQVASFADQHLNVIKSSDAGFTSSDVRILGGEDRHQELARMLSGLADSDSARAHAAELLELAKDNSSF